MKLRRVTYPLYRTISGLQINSGGIRILPSPLKSVGSQTIFSSRHICKQNLQQTTDLHGSSQTFFFSKQGCRVSIEATWPYFRAGDNDGSVTQIGALPCKTAGRKKQQRTKTNKKSMKNKGFFLQHLCSCLMTFFEYPLLWPTARAKRMRCEFFHILVTIRCLPCFTADLVKKAFCVHILALISFFAKERKKEQQCRKRCLVLQHTMIKNQMAASNSPQDCIALHQRKLHALPKSKPKKKLPG